MRVLAADLSLARTGWCDDDGITDAISTKPEHGSTVDRAEIIADCLLTLASRSVDLIVMEGLSFHSKGSASADLAKLHAVIEVRLRDGHWPFAFIAPSSVKRYATGKGNASKDLVRDAARDRFSLPGGISSDECDAVWLHAAVMDALGQPTIDVPKAHREALPAVRRALSEAGVDCEGEAA